MSEQMDKIFREKLGRYKAEVPPDLWTAIAANQTRKRQKIRLLTYGKYAVALLVLLLGGMIGWQQANGEITSETPPALPEVSIQPAPTAEALAPTLKANIDNNTASANLTDKNKNNTSANYPQLTPSNRPTATPNSTNIIPGSKSSEDQNNAAAAGTTEITNAQALALAANTETTATDVLSLEKALGFLPTLPLPRLAPRTIALPAPTANSLNMEAGGFKRSQQQRLEIDILAGPSYANQLFNTKSEENREILNAREISEFPEVSFLAGLRFSYSLKNRWSLRSGILFTQIRNQFEYEQEGNQPNEPTLLIKSSNRIRLLEIPMLLSYELPGKRFRLSLNAGAVINLSTKASGRYLLPGQMDPVNLEDENIYRSNIGLSYQASLTAAYDLGMGNSLLIEPTFKTYRTSFTLDDYGLEERYWLAGLQIGLRHRLR